MLRAHTESQVRAAEKPLLASQPEGTLMRRAASGLAAELLRELRRLRGRVYGSTALLVVGPGDNGADALHAGADLAGRGVRVHAVVLQARVHRAARDRFLAAGGRLGMPADSQDVAVVVDGVVGIGGRPGLRDDAKAFLDHVEHTWPDAFLVAVDVPSGVAVDTGATPSTLVRADLTVTFGALKVAHLVDPGALACGEVRLVDLDLPLPPTSLEALEAADVADLLPVPTPIGHKYSRGVLGVRAGSDRYPGAGMLCVAGAATGLCGMVRLVDAAPHTLDMVLARHPEVVPASGQVQAWAVGSGLDDLAARAVAEALGQVRDKGVTAVLDADALTHVGTVADRLALDVDQRARVVLTPHAGELARMLATTRDRVEDEALQHVRGAAERFGTVVLLKGRRTLVAHPDGRVRVNTTGTPWLGGAGAGDVLSGVIGALLAAGLDPFDAASVGAWLHGAAAERASAHGADGATGPVAAGDVARTVPAVVAHLLRHR